jgi:hypothetical protein
MEVLVQLLAQILRIAAVPLFAYAIVRLARRWPATTLTVLLVLIVLSCGALAYASGDGIWVDQRSRNMEFSSQTGHWCFSLGGLVVILGVPALPLLAVARVRNGEAVGPVGPQWLVVLFGYFMACLFCSMVVYWLLTGIEK